MSVAYKIWNQDNAADGITELLAATVIAKDAVAVSDALLMWKQRWAAAQVVVSIDMAATIDGNAQVAIKGAIDDTNYDTEGVDNQGGSIVFEAGATVQKSFIVTDLHSFKVAVTNGTTTAGNMTVTITAREYKWGS